MNTGFPDCTVWLLHRPGLPCLLGPDGFVFTWRGHTLRAIGYTDGMSSPQFTHALKDADPYGWALPAAIPHDAGYHDSLEILKDGVWVKFTLPKEMCDLMFKELLEVLAETPEHRAEILPFYEAVHLGGQSSFDEARGRAAA